MEHEEFLEVLKRTERMSDQTDLLKVQACTSLRIAYQLDAVIVRLNSILYLQKSEMGIEQ